MNDNVQKALDEIVELFKSGDIGEKIAIATFPPYDVPCSKWSLTNQLLCLIHGTNDARGFRQWNEVCRHVKKGATSFRILVPCHKKVEDQETSEELTVLVGFKAAPVFRSEDTEGEPLPEYVPRELPNHRLLDVAQRFGVDVQTVPYQNRVMGYYQDGMLGKRIGLASPDEVVFWHELAHAAHKYALPTDCRMRSRDEKEVIADVVAVAIGCLFGVKLEAARKLHDYILNHTKNPATGIVKLLSVIEQILKAIVGDANSFPAAA